MALPHLTSGESDESYPVNDLLHQAEHGNDQALCELFERKLPKLAETDESALTALALASRPAGGKMGFV